MKLIYILLCQEAANELYFTTSLKKAYNLYKFQISFLNFSVILRFSEFKKACYENVGSVFFQLENAAQFTNKMPENDIVSIFAMRVVKEV